MEKKGEKSKLTKDMHLETAAQKSLPPVKSKLEPPKMKPPKKD